MKLRQLKVDGGATANDALMQFQAYLAGIAVGFWKNQQDVTKNWALDREFKPEMKKAEREAKYAAWKDAVERSKGWVK